MQNQYTASSEGAQQVFSGAEIIPFQNPAKEEYTAAIRMWCVDRSLSNALSREEIGAMRAFDRVDAQRKALLLNLSHYYRTHRQADVAPGVAAAIHLMSDNDKGAAQISQKALGDFFGRSRSAIADAYERLRNDEIIVTGRGRYAAPYPVIPRAVTTGYNHLAWMVSAVCAPEANVNCPEGQDNCQLSGEPLQLDQSSGGSLQLKPVNCPASDVSIVGAAPTPIHYDTSLKEKGAREGSIAKVATAVAATFAATLPLAAAPHPVEQVVDAPAECWQTPKAKMAAGLNSMEAKLQRQIWMTPSGRVEVAGDFKAELEREFPLVDLKCGLATAGPNVNTDRGAINCTQTIRREFGFMQQREKKAANRSASYAKPATGRPKTKDEMTLAELQAHYDRGGV